MNLFAAYNTFPAVWDEIGYKPVTTFWGDFTVADAFGIKAIKDTFRRAKSYAKTDFTYATELVLVLNHKIWQHYQNREIIARLYDEIWREAQDFFFKKFGKNQEAVEYYYKVTD